jgi:hypothetical protein
MKTTTLSILLLVLPLGLCRAQITLQMWTEVFGTVPGQSLGGYVNGRVESVNLPYKAAVSKLGSTGVYSLYTQTDTAVRAIFLGSNMQTGDLNGDGWKDIVVQKSGGTTYIDTVLIYWGTPTGIDTTAPMKLTGSDVRESFGSSICIGNIIGDAIPDLIVGARQYPFGIFRGRVYVYRGGNPFLSSPSLMLTGDSAYLNLGVACAVGDLNNDGFNDLAVRGWCTLGFDSVRYDYVNVWFGGVVFDTTHDIHLRSKYITSTGLACFDANGDGIADLLWTNRDSLDWVYAHYGGTTFFTVPSQRLRDPGVGDFGRSIVNAGDMTGDGYDDIAISAPDATTTSGFVFVFAGGARLGSEFDAAVGLDSQGLFGWGLSSIGDVTGDGLSDLIIGAPNYEFGNAKGYWGIFKGDSTITGVHGADELPTIIRLYEAYPNPFNPNATIRYELSQYAHVTLDVFNTLGQQVTVLVDRLEPAGRYETVFDGSNFASGVYLYRLTARTHDGKSYANTKKLTLIK